MTKPNPNAVILPGAALRWAEPPENRAGRDRVDTAPPALSRIPEEARRRALTDRTTDDVQPARRRYPIQPLCEAMGLSVHAACAKLRVSGSVLQDYRERGVTERVADRLATRAGLHAYTVWPSMLVDAIADAEAELEAQRLRRNAQKAAQQRRKYREDPEFRERRLAENRAYKEATRRVQRLYAKKHREANRDRLAEQRRANYLANRDRILERQRAYDRARAAARRQEAA